MKFFETIEYDIPAVLRPFVLAVVQGETFSAIRTSIAAPPTGFPLLIYVYNDYHKININGQSFHPTNVPLNLAGQIDISGIRIEMDGFFGQIGLILHPLAPYYLFHVSGNEIRNGWKGLLEALPKDLKKYFEGISSNMEPIKIIAQILDGLQQLLKYRIDPVQWLDATMLEVFRNNGAISMTELVAKTPLSTRHFRRKFKEIIGISPKYYCKVIQLNSVFSIIKSGNAEKLHILALDNGYYDQAHFINDFNRLIGESPSNFLNGEFVHLRTYLGRNRV